MHWVRLTNHANGQEAYANLEKFPYIFTVIDQLDGKEIKCGKLVGDNMIANNGQAVYSQFIVRETAGEVMAAEKIEPGQLPPEIKKQISDTIRQKPGKATAGKRK